MGGARNQPIEPCFDAEAIATPQISHHKIGQHQTSTETSQNEASTTEPTDQESSTNYQNTLISSPEGLTITPEFATLN